MEDPFVQEQGKYKARRRLISHPDVIIRRVVQRWLRERPEFSSRESQAKQKNLRVMPFGQYKKQDISEVPSWYLRWVLEHVGDHQNGLHENIEQELWDRSDKGCESDRADRIKSRMERFEEKFRSE